MYDFNIFTKNLFKVYLWDQPFFKWRDNYLWKLFSNNCVSTDQYQKQLSKCDGASLPQSCLWGSYPWSDDPEVTSMPRADTLNKECPLENYSILIQELEVRMLQLNTFCAFVKLLVCRTYHWNRQRRCVWVFVVVVVVFCLFHFVCLASGTPCSWGCSVITVFLQPVTSCLNKDGPIWALISWSGLCTFDQHLKQLKSCKIIKTKIEEIEILRGRGEKFL